VRLLAKQASAFPFRILAVHTAKRGAAYKERGVGKHVEVERRYQGCVQRVASMSSGTCGRRGIPLRTLHRWGSRVYHGPQQSARCESARISGACWTPLRRLRSARCANATAEGTDQVRRLGIAEAHANYDIDGWDSCAKTAALANVLLDARVTPCDLQRAGIRDVTECGQAVARDRKRFIPGHPGRTARRRVNLTKAAESMILSGQSGRCPSRRAPNITLTASLQRRVRYYEIHMKLIRFRHDQSTHAGLLTPNGIAPVEAINAKTGVRAPNDVLGLIREGIDALRDLPPDVETLPLDAVTPILPYDVPPKIWLIGLNYKSHAEDIDAVQPEEPGSFMKPTSCMFQPEGEIVLPPPDVSNDVDAEGELAVIIGQTCRFVPAEHVRDVIFGYTTTLDLTALDILRKNPRYLTRAKSLDTFFSFGPVIVTADEIPDVDALEVITEHNGGICSRDFVRNMRTRPLELVRFHSEFMTLHPGDIISTGCPKGARIKAGDRVRARIEGIGTLGATVTQGQRKPWTPVID
jgi:2-keto-4-pentenoate hydratase/2-oxohepta-3-ene-1,7-dioic acid hydratase in catechol pathway